MEEKIRRIEIARVHASIPKPLWKEILRLGLKDDIDNLITRLLYDEVERIKTDGGKGNDRRRK